MAALLPIAVALIGLAKTLLGYLASRNVPEAVRAKIVLAALKAQDARIDNALKASADALFELEHDGLSGDTHFRD